VLAGGEASTVIRLFLAMLGIQISIGALNDLVDAPLDAAAKPRKPIPAGLVRPRVAAILAGGGAAAGLMLSGVSGPATALVGACCLALGWTYDLRLSRTSLSWLPLAFALPLLPIHAWLGASGSVPPSLLALVPVGVLAGAGLAIANGLVDVERDAGIRRAALVVRLGRRRAWLVQTLLLVVAAALGVMLAPNGVPGSALATIRGFGLVGGSGALAIGAVVIGSSRPGVRERGWELEAFGVAGIAIAWIAGMSTLGGA
jgi:4-hydroxybenzoate polyprenyltransferase